MIPNLIGVLTLSPLVMKITQNYVNRKIKGSKEEPIISFDAKIQKEQAAKAARGEE